MVNGDGQLREFGRFRLDAKKRVLWCEDEPVNLPLKEIELLCVLTESSGQVVTKAEILDRVWADSFVEEGNLSRHIYLLRKTLKEYGESEDLIQTVPRRGYRFAGKLHAAASADLVIEKHTSTRTLIEIQDESDAKALSPAYGISKRGITLIATAAGAVAIIGLIFLWGRPGAPESAAGPEIRSIAVLPVKSFSSSSNDEELRVRLTDALITRLGGLDRIAVRPTSAILPFTDSEEDSLSIGKKLQVDAVLESRLQEEGNRLRITMQLVSVADGRHLWSGQFDGSSDQILDLQDTIGARVSRSLSTAGESDSFASRLTANNEAYDAYLKGRYFWAKRDAASLHKAADYFQQAATLDPQFSEAFTGLADTQHLLFNYNIDVRPEIVGVAKENLRKALELKPNSAEALVTLGTIQMGFDWDWAGAEQTLKRAVAAAPNSPTAHMRFGALLVRVRRFDEAETQIRRQIELDPLSPTGIMNLGLVLFCKKDLVGADREYARAMELDENGGAEHWLLSRSLWLQGRKDESIAQVVRALELDGNTELAAKVRNRSPEPAEAIRALLHEWRMDPPGTNPHNLAYLSIYVNDTEKALYWLQRSIDEHHPWTSWIAAAPEFESLRSEPRYLKMLETLNLP